MLVADGLGILTVEDFSHLEYAQVVRHRLKDERTSKAIQYITRDLGNTSALIDDSTKQIVCVRSTDPFYVMHIKS